jgi:hypothetical protein
VQRPTSRPIWRYEAGGRWRDLVPMQETTERMAPVEPARRGIAALAQMVLPKFVGE